MLCCKASPHDTSDTCIASVFFANVVIIAITDVAVFSLFVIPIITNIITFIVAVMMTIMTMTMVIMTKKRQVISEIHVQMYQVLNRRSTT